jgi:hypothetical protein
LIINCNKLLVPINICHSKEVNSDEEKKDKGSVAGNGSSGTTFKAPTGTKFG